MNSHFISEVKSKVFSLNQSGFEDLALQIFRFQAGENAIFRQYCELIGVDPAKVDKLAAIPFLPISLFKTQKILCCNEWELEFTSSGTTGSTQSVHYIAEKEIYLRSIEKGFVNFFGNPAKYEFFSLLPNYLERQGSSLIYMMRYLAQLSGQPQQNFYLYDFEALKKSLQKCLAAGKRKPFLVGVSFALLDFAAQFPMDLSRGIVMETGGMKGRREEITREELHSRLKRALNLEVVHSEYGMTELLSQAYSEGEGVFTCQPWMKVLPRDPRDPLSLLHEGRGALNVIDLANIASCSFIATDDLCKVFSGGSFSVQGRLDSSDIRGCNLMVD